DTSNTAANHATCAQAARRHGLRRPGPGPASDPTARATTVPLLHDPTSDPMRDRAPTAVHPLIVVPLLAAAAVYYPIVHNYFREDDFVNLYFIENYSPARFLITVWAEHSLVTRNAIWWVLHAFVGTHPQPYFVLTFLTHLAA